MIAFEYPKSLIGEGYSDALDKDRPSRSRRLLAASGALLHAHTSTETILSAQQEELVQYWSARQLEQGVEAPAGCEAAATVFLDSEI